MILDRNLKTEVVHRPECASKGADVARWNWADGKTLAQVWQATTDYPWLHLCRICMVPPCSCENCEVAP